MSIATKTGDKGTTGMLFGARVPKSDLRIAAVGDIDELNASMGLARRQLVKDNDNYKHAQFIETVQRQLSWLMGEIVTEPEKRAEYVGKYSHITQDHLLQLEEVLYDFEEKTDTTQTDWVMYGESDIGAALDFAAKVCRRAERAFLVARDEEYAKNSECGYRPILVMYLNRLSDLLYVMARYFDYLEKLK